MKRKSIALIAVIATVVLSAYGCGKKESVNTSASESIENDRSEQESIETSIDNTDTSLSEKENDIADIETQNGPVLSKSYGVFDTFLKGEADCVYLDEEGKEWGSFNISDIYFDESDYMGYQVGDLFDVDNDGEDELLIFGPYGGFYVDYDGKGFVDFAGGNGTAVMLDYVEYDGAVWIYYYDICHGGRRCYDFYKYNGCHNIVDHFDLYVDWDDDSDEYDENSEFIYRGQKITMEEYEKLLTDIFGI